MESYAKKNLSFCNITFMHIDDNRYMRTLVKSVLHAFGARNVLEASDGADAFKIMTSAHPSLVITNLNMSPLDGLEFVRMVRTSSDFENPYLPIIMLSGHTDTESIRQARDCGVHEYVAKPVSAQVLFDRICSVVLRPRLFIKTPCFFGPDRRRKFSNISRGDERRVRTNCTTSSPLEDRTDFPTIPGFKPKIEQSLKSAERRELIWEEQARNVIEA